MRSWRLKYILACAAAIAVSAVAAADGVPTADNTSSPPGDSNGGTSNVDASQIEAPAAPGAALSNANVLLDSKLAGEMFGQNAMDYYQTMADRYATALRKSLSCARWGVVALKYESPNFHAAVYDEHPVDLFENGVLDTGACHTLKSSGVGASVAYAGSKYAVWVVNFYRLFSVPPTWATTAAEDVVVGNVKDCTYDNWVAVGDLDNVSDLSVCVRATMETTRAVDYLLVAPQLKPFMATNIPPRTTVLVKTIPITDHPGKQHLITFVLQP